jgi:hypothetical protein
MGPRSFSPSSSEETSRYSGGIRHSGEFPHIGEFQCNGITGTVGISGTVEGPSRVEGFGVAVTTLVASLRAAKVSLEAVYAEVPPARIKNKMGVPMAAQKENK